MSEQDNLRVVQGVYEAFGRGDVEGLIAFLADDFEWHQRGAPIVPWARSRSTKDEIRSFFRELNEAVEILALDIHKFVAQGDTVVALGVLKARARKTGKEFEDPWAMAWTLRDGKVVGYRAYEDTRAMAEAFG